MIAPLACQVHRNPMHESMCACVPVCWCVCNRIHIYAYMTICTSAGVGGCHTGYVVQQVRWCSITVLIV